MKNLIKALKNFTGRTILTLGIVTLLISALITSSGFTSHQSVITKSRNSVKAVKKHFGRLYWFDTGSTVYEGYSRAGSNDITTVACNPTPGDTGVTGTYSFNGDGTAHVTVYNDQSLLLFDGDIPVLDNNPCVVSQ